jgi:hypothetical protein
LIFVRYDVVDAETDAIDSVSNAMEENSSDFIRGFQKDVVPPIDVAEDLETVSSAVRVTSSHSMAFSREESVPASTKH